MSGRDYYPVNQPAQQGYGGRTYAPPANSQGQQQRQDSYSSNQQQHQGDYSQNSYDDSYSHQQQQSSNGAAAYYDQNQYHQQSYQDNYGGGSSPYGNPSSHQDQYFSQANGNGGYGGHSPNLNASPQPGYNDGSDVGRGLMSDYNEPGAYPSGGLGAPYKAGSMASDSMANLNNDYDSVHELWRGQGPRPSGDNASYNGSSIALEKYEDGGWNSSGGRGPSKLGMGGTAGDVDPYDARAAGLAKYGVAKNTSNSKKAWMLAGIALLVVCLAGGAVALVYEFVIKKKGGGSIFGGGDSSEKTVTFGGNGSTVTFTNGTKYVYINPHGGTWNSEPFNDTAQAQSYTPPLNEEFDFVKNRILGVNLGSWFVTEPFIVPGLYQPYANLSTPIGDEYDLSLRYIQDGGKANLEKQMRQHYETFITEEDFAMIAAAGLNWVRMPFGFWAIETYSDEPYLEGVAWEYIQRAIGWARKYGIRINLDLHAVPGSQNGYNHSGKLGNLNWLNGPMGYANAQRTLNIIRTVTEFLSQPEIKNVVPMFSVLNEPNIPVGIGMDHLQNFMAEVYTMVRNITGEGKGNGPIMTLHDGFMGLDQWKNFLRGSDRVFYDEHPYICFGTPQTNDWSQNLPRPCNSFALDIDKALTNNGMAMAGEWSLAVNDCSLYLNNVGVGARFDGSYSAGSTSYGSCEPWNDWENYNETTKSNLKDFALVQMDSLKNFFFWTWKIGDSIETGKPVNPMWSYKLGIQQGWMPENPATDPEGACESVGSRFGVSISATTLWQSTFSDWMTGGAATYTVVPTSSGNNWPPSVVSGSNSATFSLATIPSYAQTGSVITLPVANMTSSTKPTATVSIDGWENSADTDGWFTSIAGCTYPTDAYTIANNDFGDWPCGANARRDHVDAAGRHHKRASPTQIDPRHEAPRSIATPAP